MNVMCRKYQVRGEGLTLKEVIARLENKPQVSPKVTYSKQEIVSAAKVLDRLAARRTLPVAITLPKRIV